MSQRFGSVIKVKPEKLEVYKQLHSNVWEDIIQRIKKCHIENYSIYLKDGYLFSYYEYTGTDYLKDMQLMKDDQRTREWWQLTDPCQEPLETRKEGEWWATMEEVFHLD
jgi:L-rhamnose mutarotase